ncbi:TetR family transcriptional regulator [Skermania sp. ID1734]|uniref:TetR/AcrR family transcriptional regulator n=1 Tax=Skermania sp. ID1734 TaxID=2597516 RepID=UPI00118147CC|nr:TetR family transcriptional regulator [Skermania sp. ID1734]TSE02025.1 TetR family transcriptional regulator [Skermania sp. ID1734]
MARLTRAESQAQTRAQLIETAKQTFFADGYQQTSLEKVAEAAGYSKGAVYSNFRNKDELCTAVLDEVRREQIGEVLAIVGQPDMETRLERLREWAQRVIGDPGWTTLEVEFAIHARPDDQLRSDLAGRLDGILGLIASAPNVVGDVELMLPAREVATILLALGVGLGLFRAIDPSIPIDGLIDTLRILTSPDRRGASTAAPPR